MFCWHCNHEAATVTRDLGTYNEIRCEHCNYLFWEERPVPENVQKADMRYLLRQPEMLPVDELRARIQDPGEEET